MNKKEVIHFFKNQVIEINKSIDLVNKIGELPHGARYLGLTPLIIEVNTLKDLEVIQSFLYERLNWNWKGRIKTVWFSMGEMCASFVDKKYDFSVWLCMPPKDFPDNLIPGAKVVELEPEVRKRFGYIQKGEEK